MRSISRWLLPASLALALAGCSSSDDGGGGKQRRVVVLFTTDEHSQLFASSPELDDFPLPTTAGTGTLVGGVARRLAILERERADASARGVDTLTLSSGDFSQGSLASAAWLATSPELRLMKRMGYDAVSLGNHEFDLGPAALAAAVGAAATAGEVPPLLLTNLFFSDESAADDALAAMYGTEAGKLIAPYRVLTTAQGLRIGLVSSMGVEAGTVAGAAPPVTFWSAAAITDEQKFGSILATVQAAVDQLREVEDVDAVILLGHGGISANPADPGEDEGLGFFLRGVDVVLSGHSHLSTPVPRIMLSPTGPVPVFQAKAYGAQVGRIELSFSDDVGGPRYLGYENLALLPVDDRTVPTTDAAFLGELYALTMGYLEAGNPATPAVPSFLESTLSKVLGQNVVDDPAVLGDLYFMELCKTDFDVIGLAPGETNAMNLDADAMLAAANGFAGPTAVALQASGPMRGDLLVGKTGAITFADLYHVVPLGGDPTAGANPNAIPGYPLVRVIIPTAALRGALEGTLQRSIDVNGDFFVSTSGLVVNYDMSRPRFDPTFAPAGPGTEGLGEGWITFMALADGTPLYDVSNPALDASLHFAVNPATHVLPSTTTFYVASLALALGVPILDGTGQPITSTAALTTAIVRRSADGSAVKDYEALAAFVKAQCDGNVANPGFLPARYDAATAEGAVPRRMVDCTGGCP